MSVGGLIGLTVVVAVVCFAAEVKMIETDVVVVASGQVQLSVVRAQVLPPCLLQWENT